MTTTDASTPVTPDGPDVPDASAQYALLAPLVPTGLDLTAARARVEAAAAGRRRTRRVLAGSCAALVFVAGCVAVALLGGTDPDDIVADGDRSTDRSTTTVSTTTEVERVEVIQVAPSVVTVPPLATTTTLPVTTTVPVTLAPPTTAPAPAPNQPLRVELGVATPRVDAGDVARIDVAWSDPDHGGVAPNLSVDWGDPVVSVISTVPPSAPCDAPGPPSGGTDQILFRYATPGVHEVAVTVSTCDGLGAYGERVRATARIEVVEPAGGAERAVVAFVPRRAGAEEPPLDDAVAELVAADSTVTPLSARRPTLAQYTSAGPATVLRVPVGALGTLRVGWPGSSCTASGLIDLPGAAADSVPQVLLNRTC